MSAHVWGVARRMKSKGACVRAHTPQWKSTIHPYNRNSVHPPPHTRARAHAHTSGEK